MPRSLELRSLAWHSSQHLSSGSVGQSSLSSLTSQHGLNYLLLKLIFTLCGVCVVKHAEITLKSFLFSLRWSVLDGSSDTCPQLLLVFPTGWTGRHLDRMSGIPTWKLSSSKLQWIATFFPLLQLEDCLFSPRMTHWLQSTWFIYFLGLILR